LFVARRAEASMMTQRISQPVHPDVASLVAELLGVAPTGVRGTESPDAYLLAFVVHHAVGHDRPDYIRLLLRQSGYQTLL
jgi:hypothetical protein